MLKIRGLERRKWHKKRNKKRKRIEPSSKEGKSISKTKKKSRKNGSRIMQMSDIRCRSWVVGYSSSNGLLANRHLGFPELNVNYPLLCS